MENIKKHSDKSKKVNIMIRIEGFAKGVAIKTVIYLMEK
jgi:hypothetical protein